MEKNVDLSVQDNYFDFPKQDNHKKMHSHFCLLCQTKKSSKSLLSIGNCQHLFCSKCLRSKVQSCLQFKIPITCPIDECQTNIDITGKFFTKLSKKTQQIIMKQKELYIQQSQKVNIQHEKHRISIQVYRKSFAKRASQDEEDQILGEKHQKQSKQQIYQFIETADPKLKLFADQQYLIAKRIVQQREKALGIKKEPKQQKLREKQQVRIQDGQFYQDWNRQINYSQKQSMQNMLPLINKHGLINQRKIQGKKQNHKKSYISKRKILIYPIIFPLGFIASLSILLLGLVLIAILLLSILCGYVGTVASVIFLIKSFIFDQDQDQGLNYILSLFFCLLLLIMHKIVHKTLKEAIPACFKQSKKLFLKTAKYPCLRQGDD